RDSKRCAIARDRAGLRHDGDIGAARIDDVGLMLLGAVLNQQLLELTSGAAGLEADFDERIFALESADYLAGAVARHRRIPDDLVFSARFLFQGFLARFFGHAIELLQSLLDGCSEESRHREQETDCNNCRWRRFVKMHHSRGSHYLCQSEASAR